MVEMSIRLVIVFYILMAFVTLDFTWFFSPELAAQDRMHLVLGVLLTSIIAHVIQLTIKGD